MFTNSSDTAALLLASVNGKKIEVFLPLIDSFEQKSISSVERNKVNYFNTTQILTFPGFFINKIVEKTLLS